MSDQETHRDKQCAPNNTLSTIKLLATASPTQTQTIEQGIHIEKIYTTVHSQQSHNHTYISPKPYFNTIYYKYTMEN